MTMTIIPHTGTACPVPAGTYVEVRAASDTDSGCHGCAENFDWDLTEVPDGRIARYRVLPRAPVPAGISDEPLPFGY